MMFQTLEYLITVNLLGTMFKLSPSIHRSNIQIKAEIFFSLEFSASDGARPKNPGPLGHGKGKDLRECYCCHRCPWGPLRSL